MKSLLRAGTEARTGAASRSRASSPRFSSLTPLGGQRSLQLAVPSTHWGSRPAAPALGASTRPLLAQQLSRRSLCACRAALEPENGTSTSASHLAWTPHPFREADYHRVSFVPAPYGPMKLFEDSQGGTFNGVLVFRREADPAHSSDDLDVLEVFVAGDTAYNTWSLLTHRLGDRPMVHELMWSLLERAHGGDAHNWTLLRVAIVELRENVFIGRLFFGDKHTGEVLWDCDCRPSDGVYLSLRSDCPFYIHRRVWDQAAQPVRSSSVYKLVAASSTPTTTTTTSTSTNTSNSSSTSSVAYQDPQGSAPSYVVKSGTPGGTYGREEDDGGEGGGGGGSGNNRHSAGTPTASRRSSGGGGGRAGGEGNGGGEWHGKAANPLATAESLTVEDVTLIRPDDPDAIKLLKRQLLLAVAEENYAAAARIRDHAWMNLYRNVHVLRLRGRYEDAHRLEMELKRQIDMVAL